MSTFALYFILILDNIRNMFILLLVLGCIGLVVYTIAYYVNFYQSKEDNDKTCEALLVPVTRSLKIFVSVCIVSTLVLSFLPSTKQMAVIYLVPKIVNNEQVQNIAGTSLKILEGYTQKYLDELAGKAEKESK
jgi:hypothetical protein